MGRQGYPTAPGASSRIAAVIACSPATARGARVRADDSSAAGASLAFAAA
jgi:hypothetical protein